MIFKSSNVNRSIFRHQKSEEGWITQCLLIFISIHVILHLPCNTGFRTLKTILHRFLLAISSLNFDNIHFYEIRQVESRSHFSLAIVADRYVTRQYYVTFRATLEILKYLPSVQQAAEFMSSSPFWFPWSRHWCFRTFTHVALPIAM